MNSKQNHERLVFNAELENKLTQHFIEYLRDTVTEFESKADSIEDPIVRESVFQHIHQVERLCISQMFGLR